MRTMTKLLVNGGTGARDTVGRTHLHRRVIHNVYFTVELLHISAQLYESPFSLICVPLSAFRDTTIIAQWKREQLNSIIDWPFPNCVLCMRVRRMYFTSDYLCRLGIRREKRRGRKNLRWPFLPTGTDKPCSIVHIGKINHARI